MHYKHSCVVDANGNYITFVLVLLKNQNEETTQVIQGHTLQDGESLVDTLAPDMVKAHWTGVEWEETATPKEIAAHKVAQQALFG